MQFTDIAMIAGTRRREDGYLVADARIARTGVQMYLGSEVGRPDMGTVRVYRPGSEVFSRDTLASAAHRPVTNDHPPEQVNAENWKQYAVGQTGDEVAGEGIFVRVPLMVSDADAIRDIEAGKRELSAGYTCELEFVDGKTEAGEPYDAVQKNIRLNHVAIVASGRAGSEVRIGDGAVSWGASPLITTSDKKEDTMSDALKTVVLGDKAVQVAITDIAAVEAYKADAEKKVADAEKSRADAIAAKDAEIVKKDEEIGTLKAELQKAKDAAPKPADLDKMVADRAALVTVVKAIDGNIDPAGMSDADLRKAAVSAKLGEEMVKDASDAEITGMFRAISKDATSTDAFAAAVKDGVKPTAAADKVVNDAYAKMVQDLQSAHRPAAAN